MMSMVLVVELARVVFHGIEGFVVDARRYGELSFDERHLFWKRAQSAAFVALMPGFLVVGGIARSLAGRRGPR